MKITKKDLFLMFARFLRASNNDQKKCRLDHNSVYGGWKIERDLELGSFHPFGETRMKTGELYYALKLACNAMEDKEFRENGVS